MTGGFLFFYGCVFAELCECDSKNNTLQVVKGFKSFS